MNNQDENLNEIVASRIKEVCKMNDITLEQFAETCGMPIQELEEHMNGEREWLLSEMQDIKNAFHVCMEYMIGRYPYPLPEPFTKDDLELFELLMPMNEEQLTRFIEKMYEVAKEYGIDVN